jgi:hypothetical protein
MGDLQLYRAASRSTTTLYGTRPEIPSCSLNALMRLSHSCRVVGECGSPMKYTLARNPSTFPISRTGSRDAPACWPTGTCDRANRRLGSRPAIPSFVQLTIVRATGQHLTHGSRSHTSRGRGSSPRQARMLFAQYHAQEAVVNCQCAVARIIDKAQLTELVHEMTGP